MNLWATTRCAKSRLSRRPSSSTEEMVISVGDQIRKLLGVIETSTHTGLRDRALLGVLAYTFARIGAAEGRRLLS
jgi:hypothetical protein